MTGSKNGQNVRLQGIAVSPGIIIGKARLVDRSEQKIVYQYLVNENDLTREVERFKNALQATREQITTIKNKMPEQLKQHAFILDTHQMIIDDSMVSDATVKTILEEKINAEWALKKSVQKINKIFSEIEDEYIKGRATDVENVAERILRNLAERIRRACL
jgi:phosphoenolpyruvate-protein phosphotransferase (PTS system enzyme I)